MRTSTFRWGRAPLALAALLFVALPAMAADQISPQPILQFFTNNGQYLVGGKLFTYAAGSTTKTDTFIDANSGTPNQNPVILDTRGQARVWLTPGQAYKFVLSPSTDTDPPTNAIWTVDNLIGVGTGTITSLTAGCDVTLTPSPITVTGSIGLTTIANNTVLGNISGGVACPSALTSAQLTTLCALFSDTLPGCVPLSGGGTANFLRADATWAAPDVPGIPFVISTTQSITVPATGVTHLYVQDLWGGGGGGGGGAAGVAASGGAGGGYCSGVYTVTPSASVLITIGAAGTGGATTANGTAGTTSSVASGAFCAATGGGAGKANGALSDAPGAGSGGTILNFAGQYGRAVNNFVDAADRFGSAGGAAFKSPAYGFGGIGANGSPAAFPGAGGMGVAEAFSGGNGGAGMAVLQWLP